MHCTQATLDDIRILRAKDAAVAHCPKSNAKLGCGIAPLADLLHQGVRVGLGTDSPAASNIMDMFDEMRTMLLAASRVERDVTVLDAERCVRIATLGGAEALGLAGDVGSLEPGKCADFIAVDVSRSHFQPIANPYSALVYGANQDDVFLTVVGGRVLYRDRVFTTVDDAAVRDAAHAVRQRLQERVSQGRADRRRRVGLVADRPSRDPATRKVGSVLLDRKKGQVLAADGLRLHGAPHGVVPRRLRGLQVHRLRLGDLDGQQARRRDRRPAEEGRGAA